MNLIIVDATTWASMQAAIARIDATVATIATTLNAIKAEEDKIMADVDDVQTAVTAEDTVIGSAVTLLQQLNVLLAAAGTDPVKLAALQTDITNQTAALSAAIVANTPGAPTPEAALAAARKAVAES